MTERRQDRWPSAASLPRTYLEAKLYVEARATKIVAGTAPGTASDVHCTIRVSRAGGEDTGELAWARRAASAAWEPMQVRTPCSRWTGVIPDGETASLGFSYCDLAPGEPAGFDDVSFEVTVREVDAGHVAFDARLELVVCHK